MLVLTASGGAKPFADAFSKASKWKN